MVRPRIVRTEGTPGATGPQGPAGDTGPQGPAGAAGATGAAGAAGATGATGPAGPGLPTGGVAGTAPVKQSGTNYDTAWVDIATQAELDAVAAAAGSAHIVAANLVNDARYVTDAVTNATTTVTSATAAFVAGDVGKVANLSTYRYLEVSMTAASNIVTATTGTFTANDVDRTIDIDGIGTGGLMVSTTISGFTDSTHVTVAVSATSSVTTRAAMVSAGHQTTIASVTNGTTVVLTAAPAWTATGVHLALGTDNRAALLAAVNAARIAKKPLDLGSGRFLVAFVPGAHASDLNAGDLRVFGRGRNATELICTESVRPTSAHGASVLFRSSSGTLELQDFSVRFIGRPQQLYDAANQSPDLVRSQCNDSGGNNEVRLLRVDTVPLGHVITIESSTGYRSRLVIDDCNLETHDNVVSYFRGAASDDHVFECRDSVLSSISYLSSTTEDTAQNKHTTYATPSVAYIWDNVLCKTTQHLGGLDSLFHVHWFSESNTTPPAQASTFTKVRFQGGYWAARPIPFAANESQGATVFEDCEFETLKGLDIISGPIYCNRSVFRTASQAIRTSIITNTSDVTHTFRDCTFDNRLVTQTQGLVYVEPGHRGATWVFEDCRFYAVNAPSAPFDMIKGASSSDPRVVIRGGSFIGAAGNDATAIGLHNGNTSQLGSWLVEDVLFSGEWLDIIGDCFMDADDFTSVQFNNNRFMQTAGSFLGASGSDVKNGNVGGRDNHWSATLTEPTGDPNNLRSMAFIPSRKKSPTALTVTSGILSPGLNHDWFSVTGAASITSIRVGGTSSTNKARSGDLYLTAVTGTVTLTHGSGNIRCNGAVNKAVAVGDTVHLRADERGNLWYVVD